MSITSCPCFLRQPPVPFYTLRTPLASVRSIPPSSDFACCTPMMTSRRKRRLFRRRRAGLLERIAPARLTLDDTLSLVSDGKGPYIDGESGVRATVNNRNGDFTLRFMPISPRTFSLALTKPVDSTIVPRRGSSFAVQASKPRFSCTTS